MIKRSSVFFLLFIVLYVESLELCQQSYGNFTVEPVLNLKYACSYADLQTDKLYGRLYLEDLSNVTLETPYTYVWRMQLKAPDSLGLKAKNCSLSTLYDIGVLARYQPSDNTTGPVPLNLIIASQYVLTTCSAPYYAFNSTSTYSINLNTSTVTFEISGVPNITAGWSVVFDALKTEPGVIGSIASSIISTTSDPTVDCSSCPTTVPAPFIATTTTTSSSSVASKSKSSNGALIGAIVGGVIGGIVVLAIIVFLVIFFLRRRENNDNYKPSTSHSTTTSKPSSITTSPNSITTSPNTNNARTPYSDMNSMNPKPNNNIELTVRTPPPPEPIKKPVIEDDQDDSYLREFKSTVNDVNQALERNSGRNQVTPNRPVQTTQPSNNNMLLNTLSSYEINPSELKYEQEIGSGAYGVVFRGRWRGSVVAVKQLRENIDKELGSFRAEASLMAKLRPHTNVVQMLGVCTKSMPLMIVTEYLPLGSLQSFLNTPRGQSLSVQETLNIIQGIAAGMMHLSSENVVHRDLAARNVLLTADLVPKISDFGMSRYVMRVDIESTTKTTVGPLKWMAPESILDLVYNEKTDVWSFGILCWEIMSKSEPYPDLDPVQVASRVSNGKLIPSVSPLWPAVLRDLMTRCWLMNPVNRPSFAEISVILS